MYKIASGTAVAPIPGRRGRGSVSKPDTSCRRTEYKEGNVTS
jgi:hypothetical protein